MVGALEDMCPCNECLCLAACKSKYFPKLIQCDIIFRFLKESTQKNGFDYNTRIWSIVRVMGHPMIYANLKESLDCEILFTYDN